MLDSKLGINPRLTYCIRCVEKGKKLNAIKKEDRPNDGPDLVLMGNKNYVDTCKSCGMQHYGGAPGVKPRQPYHPSRKCIKCGNGEFDRRQLLEHERVPSGVPCEECQKELDEVKKIVEEGGVYWRCESCLQEGVIRGTHQFAKDIRVQMKIEAPHPLGVTFTKETCPHCQVTH